MHTSATPTRWSPIRLTFAGGRVWVKPEDGERFMRFAGRAAEYRHGDRPLCGCKRDEYVADYQRTFLLPLRAWCEANAGRVQACYVYAPTGHSEVYFIGRSEKYDFDLGDATAQFDLSLVGNGWPMHSMLVPRPENETELYALFNPNRSLEVYADRQPAPGEGREELGVPGDDHPG